MANPLYTVGHSTRSLDELARLLRAAGADTVLDVRAFPRSRRHPQFNRERLASGLAALGIGYAWAGEELGGFREPRADSRHTALAEPAFRGFADYMESAAFGAALDAVLARAARERVAIMCAEREPSQCHRSLIADAALARGARVIHLGVAEGERPARPSPAARAVDGVLVYDGGQARLPAGD